jgi:hypothetical protein
MLLGNDYLPKISNINYETLFTCYEKYLAHGNNSIIYKNKIRKKNLINYISYIIIYKNVKYNKKNLDLSRFNIYYNNLCWTLKYYNIIDNELEYIQDLPTCKNEDVDDVEDVEDNSDSKIRIRNVVNVYNFINGLI